MKAWLKAMLVAFAVQGCCFAGDLDIHSMVVGDKVLEMVETSPLTSRLDGETYYYGLSPDSRHVVYLNVPALHDLEDGTLCVVDAAGGKPFRLVGDQLPTVMPSEGQSPGAMVHWQPFIAGTFQSVWGPKSKEIWAVATRSVTTNGTEVRQYFVLVLDVEGKLRQSFCLPDKIGRISCYLSPNGRMLAADVEVDTGKVLPRSEDIDESPAQPDTKQLILILDRTDGTMRQAYTSPDLKILEWDTDNASLSCVAGPDDPDSATSSRQLLQVFADGRPPKILDAAYRERYEDDSSANGNYQRADPRQVRINGFAIRDRRTGNIVRMVSGDVSFRNWSPNDKVFAYTRNEKVEDESKLREKRCSQLWLAATEDHRLNHMLIAPDLTYDDPQWSDDLTKMVYAADHRLYLATLKWRDPSPAEKQSAGLSLSEKDEKSLMLDQAEWISEALRRYADDQEGRYPPTATVREALKPYLAKLARYCVSSPLLRPGTDTDIFVYTQPSSPEDPTTTIVGYLDAGYTWRVNIYADGSAKVEEKK